VLVGPALPDQVSSPTFTVAVNEIPADGGSSDPESILTDHVDTYTQAHAAEGTLARSPSPTSVCGHPARSYVQTGAPTAATPHPPTTYRAVAIITADDRIYEAQIGYSPAESPNSQIRDDLATILDGIQISTHAMQ
jgi:hypothetical protein